jgi:hypothetical protein
MKHAAIVLGIAVLTGSAPAAAHRGTGGKGYVSTFSAVVPNVLGLSVNVLGGDDRLRVSNYSGMSVLILGYEREPYLRFGKDGVFVNARSPAARLNRFRYPPALAPGTADASATPVWLRVRTGATFEWHDHRIHWTAKEPPAAVSEHRDRSHLIFNWRVPGRANGQPFAITGFLGYVPPPGADGGDGARSWLVPAGVASGLALFVGAVGVGARRARRRAP